MMKLKTTFCLCILLLLSLARFCPVQAQDPPLVTDLYEIIPGPTDVFIQIGGIFLTDPVSIQVGSCVGTSLGSAYPNDDFFITFTIPRSCGPVTDLVTITTQWGTGASDISFGAIDLPGPLSAGDIAFTGYNSEGTSDSFSFMLLKDIPSGTVIKFTDRGWDDAAKLRTDVENELAWTSTSEMTLGAQVVLSRNGSSWETSIGTVSQTDGAGTFDLATSGDQVFAYQGRAAAPFFLAGIHANFISGTTTASDWDGSGSAASSTSSSALPDALTNGVTAISLFLNGIEYDNAIYNGPLTGTADSLRAAINNRANWLFNDATPYPLPPAAANTAPTLSNLNGDSVTWAGVGNTVTLDSGSDAVPADTELGNNWNGASLTVRRSSGALSLDVFGFDTSGASFTSSGGNLQIMGQTFATFTSTGGVLTINFTSSTTTATTSLVQDVIRHITYRNDTPAGDATIRFTLSDGSLTVAADVTVASDSIYVTSTADTATIDLSNGVSFSEAVAIAAADTTGTQTIVLTKLDTNISADPTINENLTLDADQVIDGGLNDGTLTIGSGNTLTINNGSGDALLITTSLAGAGNVIKSGAGEIVFNVNNTYTGNTTISGGTLAVSSGDSINDGSPVTIASGATLRLDDGEKIGSLSGAGSVILNYSLQVGTDNTSTTFSGEISGLGAIVKRGTGTTTLTGTNTQGSSVVAIQLFDGTVSVTDDSNLGNGPVLFLGGTLKVTGSNVTISTKITLSSGTGTLEIDQDGVEFNGVINGAGKLAKTGSGVLNLSGSNTYTGTTTVSAGTLRINGSIGTGAVTVASGATLGGSGTIGGAVNISSGGTLAPGAGGPGTLSLGNLTIASGGAFAVDLNGPTAGTGYDRVNVNGTVNITGATISGNLGYPPGSGDMYNVIGNDGSDAITGTFNGLAEGGTVSIGGTPFAASYVGGDGNDFTLIAPATANTAPTFVGSTTSLTHNAGDGSVSFADLVHVNDTDSSQTLTWSQSSAPSHGFLTINSATASSGSSDITPGGTLTYSQYPGYAGPDSFTIQVSDGTATATRTIAVSVIPDTPDSPDLSANSDTGISNTDKITKESFLAFTGSNGPTNGTVTVFVDLNDNSSLDVGEPSANAIVGTCGDWEALGVDVSGLSDGQYKVRSFATSATGGLVSPVSNPLTITLDRVAPTLQSITLNGSPATDATSLSYTVTFSDNITRLSMDDFFVATTAGTASGVVTSVSNNSGTSATVTVGVVGSITGGGTIRLDLRDTMDVADIAGNKVAGFTSGDTHAVTLAYTNNANLNFSVHDSDLPSASPFRLNTQSLGILIPQLSQVYPNGNPCRLDLTVDPINALSFLWPPDPGEPTNIITSFQASLYVYTNATEVTAAASFSGSATLTGYATFDDFLTVNSFLSALSFSTINVNSSQIGTINTASLKFKLNLSLVLGFVAIDDLFKHQTYPVPFGGSTGTPDLTAASDTGASSTDDLTADTTPTFAGKAVAGATVELFSAGTNSLGTTTADTNGDWTITATSLSDGTYDITSKATDRWNFESNASPALTITLDTAAPTVVSIVRKTPASQITRTSPVVYEVTFSEEVANVTKDSFTVEAVNGSSIVGTVDSVSGGPTVYDVTVSITSGQGGFRLTIPALTPP